MVSAPAKLARAIASNNTDTYGRVCKGVNKGL